MGRILNETTTIYSDTDTVERNKKEKEYLDYINNHILNVKKAYNLYMIPLLNKNSIPSNLVSTEQLHQSIINCKDRIEHHDASKFGDDEFDGYRIKYYPTELEKSDPNWESYSKERSEECWIHHYENNDHHPEYWINKNTKLPTDMSLDAIIEMICDWEAMSMVFDDILSWYEKEGSKKQFSKNTKDIVEDLLFNILHNSKN